MCSAEWESGPLVRYLYTMANNETMNPDLLLKYLDNEASDQEMREVLAWLEADPANRLELDRLDRAIAASILSLIHI